MKKVFCTILFLFLTRAAVFAQSADQVYAYDTDHFPEVYGGKLELRRFIQEHMVYPAEELATKTEGSVIIHFTITKEGKAANARIFESVSTAIDKEALRLFNLLEWVASYQGDKALSEEHSLKINFSVSKYKKWVKQRGYEKAAFTDLALDSSFAVYEAADKAPSFSDPGKTFSEFVYTTLEYPEVARQQNMEGNIVMTFIVEPDGRCSNIRIQKGVGGGCNDEATRVIGLTKWKPAQKGGKYVRYRMYYTMIFNLKNSFKDNSGGSQRTWGQ